MYMDKLTQTTMSKDQLQIKRIIDTMSYKHSMEHNLHTEDPVQNKENTEPSKGNFSNKNSSEGLSDRIDFLNKKGIEIPTIHRSALGHQLDKFKGNIENFIGMAQIPIGLAGPVLLNGLYAQGDFYIPLATTEGALVASYSRGMKACRESGGITAVCLSEGVQRSPYFRFENVFQAISFVKYLNENYTSFQELVRKTSRFAELQEMKTNVEGNAVLVTFEYSTGDASGQNMVTICTDQICKYILEHVDQQPKQWYIEGNYSGDKKATALSFSNVRGKKVTAEVNLNSETLEKILKTSAEKIANYWRASTLAAVQSGAIGAQGHVANGLTAMFIACGQDVACISESSVGLTRMEVTEDNGLYVAVTLPSLIVGTVGGGTHLSSQSESLKMMDCLGEGKAQKFAEICAAVALAGEISIAAAMSADHFTSAHKNLGRK